MDIGIVFAGVIARLFLQKRLGHHHAVCLHAGIRRGQNGADGKRILFPLKRYGDLVAHTAAGEEFFQIRGTDCGFIYCLRVGSLQNLRLFPCGIKGIFVPIGHRNQPAGVVVVVRPQSVLQSGPFDFRLLAQVLQIFLRNQGIDDFISILGHLSLHGSGGKDRRSHSGHQKRRQRNGDNQQDISPLFAGQAALCQSLYNLSCVIFKG